MNRMHVTTCWLALLGIAWLGVTLAACSRPLAAHSGGEDSAESPAPQTVVTTILIPAGTFQMGCDPDHNAGYLCNDSGTWGETPLHPIYLDAYSIDRTEVSNQQYAQCVAAEVCMPPRYITSPTRYSYYDNPDYADYPVIWIAWTDADTYCDWVGGRLPTEAEWEKAARGTVPRAFPWGDSNATCTVANHWEGAIADFCVGDTVPVDALPDGASPYGVLNLAGNVAEWVSDWYNLLYYSNSPTSNPTGPDSGEFKVARGGAWSLYDHFIRTSDRFYYYPTSTYWNIGFRCVYDEVN